MLAAFKKIIKAPFSPRPRIGDPPPPYNEQYAAVVRDFESSQSSDSDEEYEPLRRSIAHLDLLSSCNFHREQNVESEDGRLSEGKEETTDMGQKTSLMYPKHRSKVSLTWVLREHSGVQYNPCGNQDSSENGASDVICGRKYDRDEFVYSRNVNGDKRIVGRSDRRFDRKIGQSMDHKESWTSTENVQSSKRRRRRKRKIINNDKNKQYFGYEIKDIDHFLAQATIDKPGNIPVVLTSPSILYQTQTCVQKEMNLSLGMVVNAVFRNQKWLYVQTPHGEEGYILYSTCVPLGILPPLQRSQHTWKNSPCWESILDIYPRPCGNMTDNEKEKLRGGTKSECGRPARKHKVASDSVSMCGERSFDKLYLKAALSCPKLREICDDGKNRNYSKNDSTNNLKKRLNPKVTYTNRHTLLIVEENYDGSPIANSLSVKKGDVVILLQGGGAETDVDSDWFYVRSKDGMEGFIPAYIASYGFL